MAKINIYENEGTLIATPMEANVAKIGELTKSNGLEIGESLKGIKGSMIEHTKERIKFLNYVLPYTNKSQLKRKHKVELKRLYFSLTSLNIELMGEKITDYLDTLSEFAKNGDNKK